MIQLVIPNTSPMHGPQPKTVKTKRPTCVRKFKRVDSLSLNLIWALSYGN